MRLLLLLIVMFTFSGCAGMDFEPKRWVEGDTFYSTKLPGIEVKVNNMRFDSKKEDAKAVTGDEGRYNTDMETTYFYFHGDNATTNKGALTIKIQSLNDQKRVYMVTPDYSKFPHSLSAGEKTLAGMRFSTGTYVVDKNTYGLLFKAYGRVVGETTRYQIYYMEQVDRDWLEKRPQWLIREYSDYLTKFNQRADTSFSISTYAGPPPS